MMQENLVLASDLVVSHVLADKPGFCKFHQRPAKPVRFCPIRFTIFSLKVVKQKELSDLQDITNHVVA